MGCGCQRFFVANHRGLQDLGQLPQQLSGLRRPSPPQLRNWVPPGWSQMSFDELDGEPDSEMLQDVKLPLNLYFSKGWFQASCRDGTSVLERLLLGPGSATFSWSLRVGRTFQTSSSQLGLPPEMVSIESSTENCVHIVCPKPGAFPDFQRSIRWNKDLAMEAPCTQCPMSSSESETWSQSKSIPASPWRVVVPRTTDLPRQERAPLASLLAPIAGVLSAECALHEQITAWSALPAVPDTHAPRWCWDLESRLHESRLHVVALKRSIGHEAG